MSLRAHYSFTMFHHTQIEKQINDQCPSLGDNNGRDVTMRSSEVEKQKRKKRRVIKVKEDTDYIESIEAQMVNLALEMDIKRKQKYII